jgi:thioredoxin-dependent peroxiredoxin
MTHLKEGDKAPNFTFTDEKGNTQSLADLKGKKVILYFYPKDMTPGCTMESCNLRDNYGLLAKNGFEVIGVSADSESRHEKFKSTFSLPFPLIADTEKEVIKAYGVWGEKKFMGRTFDGIHRVTFVIDENGNIERVFDKVKTTGHAEQILESYK